MEKEGKVWSQAALNFCQSALEKFHLGTPWSSGVVFALTFIRTIEWSLTKNSLVTVHVQTEAHELETRTKSNRLHASRPVSEKCVGVVFFRTTKSCTSVAYTKDLPLQFVYSIPHIPWWPLKSPQKITFAKLDTNIKGGGSQGVGGGCCKCWTWKNRVQQCLEL